MGVRLLAWMALFALILVSAGVFTVPVWGEEAPATAPAGYETGEEELPPAIQEFLKKEREKLPPVERHFRMAQDYHARGKLDEAVKELNESLKIDPDYVPGNCELGVIYMGQGDYDKAIEQLQKTLKLDPGYPKTHYALANAYARKPNPDIKLARQQLDEAVRLGYHSVPWFVDYLKKMEMQDQGVSSPQAEAAGGSTRPGE